MLMILNEGNNIWKWDHKPFWPLERNFFVCLLINLFALVMVNCLANGENSASLSLQSPVTSFSASPLIVRRTKALAFRLWELKSPLTEVTNPSPAPSVGRLNGYGLDFPAEPPSLSLKLRSISGTVALLTSFWLCALSLNFFPCRKDN